MLSLLILALSISSNDAVTGSNPLSTQAQQKLWEMALDYHNLMRSKAAVGVVPGPGNTFQPKGSDIVNLVWDDGLSAIAQAYANKCVYKHNPDKNTQVYSSRSNMQFKMDHNTDSIGENIGYSTIMNATEVTMDGLKAMWEESQFYVSSTGKCNQEPCGHYTQMVWADTRYIGCGVAECAAIENAVGNAAGNFFVCNYFPGGNVIPLDNYNTNDEPCDNCPWDKTKCTYDSSQTYSYSTDWKNMPSDIYSEADGLCTGCGNIYTPLCSIKKGNKDNCVNDNIENVGCSFEMDDTSTCDTTGDAENDIPDAGTCRLNDYCRYWCGFCHCNIGADARSNYDKFNTCDNSVNGCNDGLDRMFTGGCWNGLNKDAYWSSWCETNNYWSLNPGGGNGNGGGDETVDKKAICFASDQYVLIYPNYEKKKLEEVELFDKMLVYDELNDEYVWDDLMVKLHFEEGEFLNDELIYMIEFVFGVDENKNETLTMTGNHLIYVNDEGLKRADSVQIGDMLKRFNGNNVVVIEINNVFKYPRNMISYNGNLVINGIAISTFTDTIFGESKYWGKTIRFMMKYLYKYNIWRYPGYYVAQLWNEYLSFDTRQYVLKFWLNDNEDDKVSSCWYSSFMSSILNK